MISAVTFWPRWRAENEAFTSDVAVISITDPGQAPAQIRGTPDLLRLEFYDLSEPVPADPRLSAEALFTPAKASALVDFVERLIASPGQIRVVVHCEAGVCRSAAVALFVAALSGCEFATREQADLANPLVLATLSEGQPFTLEAPPKYQPAAGILLL